MSTESPVAPRAEASSPTPRGNVLEMLLGEGDKKITEMTAEERSTFLMQKSMLLMGLADKFVGTDRGKQLKTDAESLLQVAQGLQTQKETQAVLQTAQGVLETIQNKYKSQQAAGLFQESAKLWDELTQSTECKDFVGRGMEMASDWKRYGDSAEGQALLKSATQLLEGQGQTLLSTLQKYAGTTDPSKALDFDRDKVIHVTTRAQRVLSSDEDVQELLEKSKGLLADFGVTGDGAQGGGEALQQKTDDLLTHATSASTAYVTGLRQSHLGQQLLKQGTTLLTDMKTDLSPEALVEQSKKLYSDASARQAFVTKVKDAALNFLLSYLPTVQVPPIKGMEDGTEYDLANIDLGGFKVKSENVEVILNENGVGINASNILCNMTNLQWKYKQRKFPYMGGSGQADASVTGVTFTMHLVIETPAQTAAREGKAYTPDPAPQPRASSSSTTAPTAPAPAPAPATSTPSTPPRSPAAPSQTPQKPAAAAAAGGATTTATTSAPAPSSSSTSPSLSPSKPLSAEAPEWSQLRLVMTKCHVGVGAMKLTVSKSWLSGIYNMLIRLFSTTIRQLLEAKVNEAIAERSGELLKTVNVLAKDYLPLLGRITAKANTLIAQTLSDEPLSPKPTAGEAAAAVAPAGPATKHSSIVVC